MPDKQPLFWKWEDDEDDGEGVGPWWVEDSPEWKRGSVGLKRSAWAADAAHEFIADE